MLFDPCHGPKRLNDILCKNFQLSVTVGLLRRFLARAQQSLGCDKHAPGEKRKKEERGRSDGRE